MVRVPRLPDFSSSRKFECGTTLLDCIGPRSAVAEVCFAIVVADDTMRSSQSNHKVLACRTSRRIRKVYARMIRVLQFADIVNQHDFIHSIAIHADRKEFDLSVAVREERSNISAPVYPEGMRKFLVPGRGRANIPSAARQLARILRDEKIDILHTHHYDQALIGALAVRHYSKTRFIFGRHYCYNLYRIPSRLKRNVFLAAEGWANRRARRIIVPAQTIRDILIHQGIDGDKVDVVPYGFVPAKYTAAIQGADTVALRKACDSQGKFVFATFARLHEEKGHRHILRALQQVRKERPDVVLWIVGEGPHRAMVEQEIERLQLQDAVRLLGWRRDAMPLMAAADTVLHASLVDAFCQIMGEAMWLQKPLIITRVVGALDIIKHGENGLLVPLADSAALANAMLRVANEPGLCQRLGSNGAQFVSQELSVEKAMARYQDSYRKALAI